jgi:hypothetical protein
MNKERELLKRVFDTQHTLSVQIAYEIEELLAQPECEPVAWMQDDIELYVLEEKNILRGYVIPLYTAPPKREPLSEDKLDVLAEANITDEGITGYYLGFRDAEKHHGIGGKE